jgi:hypothetical protein
MTTLSGQTRRSVWQLLLIAALMGFGYACIGRLRFTNELFNFLFVCLFFLTPFLALRPVLSFQKARRVWGLALLSPLLLFSGCAFLFTVSFNGPSWSLTRIEPLQRFQLGASTVELYRYENGGALGVHGLDLEQRRIIVSGLFVVRTVDFIDLGSAFDGTLSVEGPYRVRLRAKDPYGKDSGIDRVYFLKPWVYF